MSQFYHFVHSYLRGPLLRRMSSPQLPGTKSPRSKARNIFPYGGCYRRAPCAVVSSQQGPCNCPVLAHHSPPALHSEPARSPACETAFNGRAPDKRHILVQRMCAPSTCQPRSATVNDALLPGFPSNPEQHKKSKYSMAVQCLTLALVQSPSRCHGSTTALVSILSSASQPSWCHSAAIQVRSSQIESS